MLAAKSRYIIWFYTIIYQCAVLGQVCIKEKMIYHDVPETYLFTYMETYEKSDCIFWCTDTRVATAVGTRTVQKLTPVRENVCCEGYTEVENISGNSIHCHPVCSPSCINGYCKSPGVCACNPGYIPDNSVSYNCIPLCIKGCDHGNCTAPNTCQCDLGYNLDNDVCEPVCSDPCNDGTCVAPETCQCHPGYKKSENNICEPYCSGYTAIGECIVTITCEPGWTKVIKEQYETCEPMCTEPCANGTCIAPDTCECLDGYKKSGDDICEPYCSSECSHGRCISPGTCVCNPGWYKMESNGTCLPHCDVKCGEGTCVAPNVCDCFDGYELEESKKVVNDTALCVPICDHCEGSCIAPGRCVCEPPLETIHVGIDGGPCNCLDHCSEDASKCEKTICLLTTTTTSVAEYDGNDMVEVITVSTEILSTIDEDYESTVHLNPSEVNELRTGKVTWYFNWFYATGSILILTLIIMVSVILKKKYAKSWNRNILIHMTTRSLPQFIINKTVTNIFLRMCRT